MLGGFLTVAAETGLGLRVLEIGASAGLNLRWDRFRYEAPDWAFGDAASRLTFEHHHDGRVEPSVGRRRAHLRDEPASRAGPLSLPYST